MQRLAFVFLTATTLLFSSLASATAPADLDPPDYKHLQESANEELTIKVLDVDLEWCLIDCAIRKVTVTAEVVKAHRSYDKLKTGDTITIVYDGHFETVDATNPPPVPLLQKGQTTIAFLFQSAPNTYAPSADGYTFTRYNP